MPLCLSMLFFVLVAGCGENKSEHEPSSAPAESSNPATSPATKPTAKPEDRGTEPKPDPAATDRGIKRLMADAEKGEVSFKLVTLAVRLRREGKAGRRFHAAMARYADAKADDVKQRAIKVLLTTEPLAEIDVLIALDMLKKDDPTVSHLRALITDAAKGTIGVDVPAAAAGAFRAGYAGKEFRQALADYAKAKTDEAKKEAAAKVLAKSGPRR